MKNKQLIMALGVLAVLGGVIFAGDFITDEDTYYQEDDADREVAAINEAALNEEAMSEATAINNKQQLIEETLAFYNDARTVLRNKAGQKLWSKKEYRQALDELRAQENAALEEIHQMYSEE